MEKKTVKSNIYSLNTYRKNKLNYNELFEMALNGTLPKDFNKWELSGKLGRTIAHAAALTNHLPKDFNQWEIRDTNGTTVAHMAALFHHLPEDFDKWDLVNNDGCSVRDNFNMFK